MASTSRTQGASKHYKPSGRTVRYEGLYLGFVKDNTDIQKMGRLKVWIPEFGSQEGDENAWMVVSYASPFAGATSPKTLGNNDQVAETTQTSYGFWAIPPDLDNQVLIMFVNGDSSRGVVIGCLFQQFMNKMVPGLPADKNIQFPSVDVPVSEYNKRTTQTAKEDIVRPALLAAAEGINAQGLIKDTVRGPSSSGARREAPSQVYGLLTPGPENSDAPGHRLGGSQFVMDDGNGSEHIRLRTRSGAQMLVDESNGIVYAINAAGTSWMQMDAEGNFDVFGAKSVSVRSQEDINLRADNDLIMEAGRNVTIKAAADKLAAPAEGAAPIAGGQVGPPLVGEGGEVIIEAANDFTMTSVQGNLNTTVLVGDYDMTVTGDRKATVIGSDNVTATGGMAYTTAGSLDVTGSSGVTMTAGGVFGVSSSNFNVAGGGIGTSGNVAAGGNVTAGGDVQTASMSLNGLQAHTHKIASGSSAGSTLPFTGSGGGGNITGPVAGIATVAIPAVPTVPLPKVNNLALFVPPLNTDRVQQPVLTMVGRFLTFEPCPEHSNTGGAGGIPGI